MLRLNIFFVYVSEKSFSNITFFDSLRWMAIVFASVYGYNLLSAKSFFDRTKDLRRRIQKMGAGLRGRCSLAFRRLRSQN